MLYQLAIEWFIPRLKKIQPLNLVSLRNMNSLWDDAGHAYIAINVGRPFGKHREAFGRSATVFSLPWNLHTEIRPISYLPSETYKSYLLAVLRIVLSMFSFFCVHTAREVIRSFISFQKKTSPATKDTEYLGCWGVSIVYLQRDHKGILRVFIPTNPSPSPSLEIQTRALRPISGFRV